MRLCERPAWAALSLHQVLEQQNLNEMRKNMTTKSISIEETTNIEFETAQVVTIAGAHFIHDVYTAFIAPLLPLIIEKLSISLTLAGSLTTFLQLPGLLNPFIGYMADKVSLRYFVILAPAVTATLISVMGFAPSYLTLAALLLVTGVSVAAFHAPAPAMVAEVSKQKVGLGMSLFMAGGELGRTLGPLLAVWAVSIWTLDGFYRIMVLGWAASGILFWRLHNISARPRKSGNLRAIIPLLRSLYLPLVFITLFKNFMLVSLSVYLPTFLNSEGSSLLVAGGALSIFELAGVGGALLSGTLSDRFGRKLILVISTILATVFMLLFLNIGTWARVPILLGLGFTALSATPVMLAIVQDHLPDNRAVGNGLFMSISFLMQLLAVLSVGAIGDHFGLRTAFTWSAILALLAVPPILVLPGLPGKHIA
jgi:FSR family fosmidomycin resistance protein-like MFS transporter